MGIVQRLTQFIRPSTGEQTKPQTVGGMAQYGGSESSDIWRMLTNNGGGCDSGTYKTYREMLNHPTLALCHAAATAPIIAAGWSVESDDDAPEDAIKLIEDVFDKHRTLILTQACRAVYYGWQSFERVWGIDDDGRLVIEKFKPLIPDRTEIVIDREHGNVLGIKQDSVKLDNGHCLIFTYDQEGDNPYGRSRMENVRKWAYRPWTVGAAKLEQYQGKAAGVVPVVRYPAGQGQDAQGRTIDNSVAAASILSRLSNASGIIAPNTLQDWAMDALRSGAKIEELLAWQFSFLETRSGHGSEFIGSLSYQDKLMVRGYLIPERAILEGQFGTKAEAGVHGDIAVLISQQWLDTIIAELNRQAVDDVLEANFGKTARGKVYLKSGPIQDTEVALYQSIVTALLTANPDMAKSDLDFDAMYDALKLPKYQEDLSEQDPLMPIVDAVSVQADGTNANADTTAKDTSLNGIQITALRELAAGVTNKEMSIEVAKQIAYIAFPAVDRAEIDKIMDGAAAFTPTQTTDANGKPFTKAFSRSLASVINSRLRSKK